MPVLPTRRSADDEPSGVGSPDPHRAAAGVEVVGVCLPDMPERAHMGELPANVEVLLVPPAPGPVPDLAGVDLIVPLPRGRQQLFELLSGPPGRLRVIQTLSAGVDWLAGRVPEHVTVCNARGVYDGPLAEWVVGAILAMQRGHIRARDAQVRAEWDYFEPDELAGRRVVILGLGSIGTAIAERLRPFGVEIAGVGRTARAGVHGIGELDELLGAADILVSMLPLTSETTGLLDARRLALLPDGALLVNAGRGRTVETTALVSELQAGRLRAVLDVTDPEPLPADHPLWVLPNVLITPHMAGDSPATTIRAFELAGDQVRRFAAGQPLINEVPRHLLI
jgi:phosphoglycerate dehydrogenase-like enzyme